MDMVSKPNLKSHREQVTSLKCTFNNYGWAAQGNEILFNVVFLALWEGISQGLQRCCHYSIIF